MQTRLTPAVCAAAIAFAGVVRTFAEVLLDQMDMVHKQTYNYANGNAIGGDNLFGNGRRLGIELANDFRTTKTGHVVVQVEVANLVFLEETRITDARVSIYADIDGSPEETAVYSERFSSMDSFSPAAAPGVTNYYFDDGLIGLRGVRTFVSGLHIVLEPDSPYFICVQVLTGQDDWAYTVRDDVVYAADSFGRDGPPDEDECGCGWASSKWQSFSEGGLPAGDAAYRIVATGSSPPPPPMPGPEPFVEPAETDPPPHPMARAGRRNKQKEKPCKRD